MSSGDESTNNFLSLGQLATLFDGAVIGIGLAVYAAGSWINYLSSAAALRSLRDAHSLQISDLRWIVNPSTDVEHKLVIVRGRVLPKSSLGAGGGVLVS